MKKFEVKENELIYLEDGRRVAIDRSVGVVMLCFIKKEDDIYVLCNLRGNKTSEYKSYWNLPSGYLNWGETGEEAAIRETLEETGIKIPIELVKEAEHSTDPSENRQNVIFRYYSILPLEYLFKKLIPMDKEEVLSIKWISLSELDKYCFAFNQKETIKRIVNKVLLNIK